MHWERSKPLYLRYLDIAEVQPQAAMPPSHSPGGTFGNNTNAEDIEEHRLGSDDRQNIMRMELDNTPGASPAVNHALDGVANSLLGSTAVAVIMTEDQDNDLTAVNDSQSRVDPTDAEPVEHMEIDRTNNDHAGSILEPPPAEYLAGGREDLGETISGSCFRRECDLIMVDREPQMSASVQTPEIQPAQITSPPSILGTQGIRERCQAQGIGEIAEDLLRRHDRGEAFWDEPWQAVALLVTNLALARLQDEANDVDRLFGFLTRRGMATVGPLDRGRRGYRSPSPLSQEPMFKQL